MKLIVPVLGIYLFSLFFTELAMVKKYFSVLMLIPVYYFQSHATIIFLSTQVQDLI